MENNKLIKVQSGLVKQVGNVISITNKLLSGSEEAILIPYRKKDKWGFCLSDKRIVIDCIYDTVLLLKNGIARVTIGKSVLYLDKSGRQITKYISERMSYVSTAYPTYIGGIHVNTESEHIICDFHEGLASQVKDGKLGFINEEGDVIIAHTYDYENIFEESEFHEGLARVKYDNKWGYIDTIGNIVISFKYDFADHFDGGIAQVILNSKAYLINRGGDIVGQYFDVLKYEILDEIFYFNKFSDNLLLVKKNLKWGYLNRLGKFAIENIYDDASGFSNGIAKIAIQDKWGIIDLAGKLIVPIIYDELIHSSEGLIRAKKKNKWGILDTTNRLKVPIIYDELGIISEGLFSAKKNGKCGFIDSDGTTIISLMYDKCGNFYDGLALASISGKCGFIDKKGSVVVPLIYDKIRRFSEGYASVCKAGKWGFVSLKGSVVVPLIYKAVSKFKNNIASIKNENDLDGFIDNYGNQFWED